jgi:hypothetical protein
MLEQFDVKNKWSDDGNILFHNWQHHQVNSLLKYSYYPFENEYNNGLFSSWVEAWNQLCGSLKVDGYHQSSRTNFTHYFIVC